MLSFNPNNLEVLSILAETKIKLNDLAGAEKIYTEIIKLTQGNAKVFYSRGLIKIQLGKKNEGCSDLQAAGEMGLFEAYEQIQKNCGKGKK